VVGYTEIQSKTAFTWLGIEANDEQRNWDHHGLSFRLASDGKRRAGA